jgi:hypothetical protein
MEQTLERLIDALLFSVAGGITIIWHYFTNLPAIVQLGIVIGFAFVIFYKKGWNDAMSHLRDEGIVRLINDYERRRR